jgi:outer membrane protein assembly factor BamB
MEELLTHLMGKKIALTCGTNSVIRGEAVSIKDGILYIQDKDGKAAYVALDKIAVVWEISEHESRAGFISQG